MSSCKLFISNCKWSSRY